MIILYAAGPSIDQAKLDELLTRYDSARIRAEKEQLAAEIEELVGGTVQGMLASNLGGLGLNGDDLQALTTEAVRRGLRESGLTRLKRQDVVPEVLLQQMRTTQRGQALWALLSPQLQQDLGATYIKSSVGQALSEELSRLLEMPDLAGKLGERGNINPSMVERTAANSELLHRLFPGAIAETKAPPRNLLGWVSKTILPELKRRLLREKQPSLTDTMRADWNIIRPYVEALRGELSREPSADQVYERYKTDVEERTRGARTWMAQQIARIQPNNPFEINKPVDLKVARELLESAGVDPKLWRDPGAPYYVAKREIKPLGRKVVENLLAAMSAPASPSAEKIMPTMTAPAIQQGEPVDWSPLMRGIGTRERVQSAVLDRIFPPGSAYELERRISLFNLDHPVANPADIERLVASLPSDLQEDLQSVGGYEAVARKTDRKLREALSSEELRQEVAMELGLMSQAVVDHAVDKIRRAIFMRNSRRIVTASSSQSILPKWAEDAIPDEYGKIYLVMVELVFGRLGLNAMRSVGQYISGNPCPSQAQIEEFVDSLPEKESSMINAMGWSNIVRLMDEIIAIYMGQDGVIRRVREMLDLPAESADEVAASVRRAAHARAARGMRRAG